MMGAMNQWVRRAWEITTHRMLSSRSYSVQQFLGMHYAHFFIMTVAEGAVCALNSVAADCNETSYSSATSLSWSSYY
jgi:hypothetical protein